MKSKRSLNSRLAKVSKEFLPRNLIESQFWENFFAPHWISDFKLFLSIMDYWDGNRFMTIFQIHTVFFVRLSKFLLRLGCSYFFSTLSLKLFFVCSYFLGKPRISLALFSILLTLYLFKIHSFETEGCSKLFLFFAFLSLIALL